MAVTKDAIDEALEHGHTIDITTTGRRSGKRRRIEIVFHNIDGRVYISGTPSPRKRSWLANLETDPQMTFHLKGMTRATSRPRLASSMTSRSGERSCLTLRATGVVPTSSEWSSTVP